MSALQAVIFDLDGVLTDTARLHYLAWKQLADELAIRFDRTINEKLKGVDRMASLEILLGDAAGAYSADDKLRMAAIKNGYYRRAIGELGSGDLLPGAAEALRAVKDAGLRIALASASRNAPELLERLEIASRFDYIADANLIRRHKPDPEIFLNAAAGLEAAPAACLGIEDAAAGIAAIKAAGMRALGVGDPHHLAGADRVIASMVEFRLEDCLRLF